MNANGHDSINFNLSDEHREIQRLARDPCGGSSGWTSWVRT